MAPNDPINTNKGFYSGCGGQAFLTLFDWHDINVTPTLLTGDPSDSAFPQSAVAMQLNGLRDYLGTFESFSDMGATTPWGMVEGVDYAHFQLNHSADWVMMFGGSAVQDLMGKMVRDMMAGLVPCRETQV